MMRCLLAAGALLSFSASVNAGHQAGILVWRLDSHGKPEVLLGDRNDNSGWCFPGGKTKVGETPKQAAIRVTKKKTLGGYTYAADELRAVTNASGTFKLFIPNNAKAPSFDVEATRVTAYNNMVTANAHGHHYTKPKINGCWVDYRQFKYVSLVDLYGALVYNYDPKGCHLAFPGILKNALGEIEKILQSCNIRPEWCR